MSFDVICDLDVCDFIMFVELLLWFLGVESFFVNFYICRF